MALLKPNTRRKLPSTELNLDNSRGLISPSVRGLLLEFPHALRYGLNIERLLFRVFRYPIESIRFLRGCSLLYCRHHFTSLIERQYRRILPVASQCIPSIPGKNKAAPLGRGLYPIFSVNSGSLAIKVDADYTFQSYPGLRSVTGAFRPKQGLLFHYENYGFEQHADLVGDRKIPLRVVLTWQDSSRTGCILAIADVSSVDSKTDSKRELFRAEVGHRSEAERLRRSTIPVLKEVGQDS